MAFDNLSWVPVWLSDGLCCLATGGGISVRQLYSDDEEAIFAASRPALLTSIADVVKQDDLLDRCVPLLLEHIPDAKRLTEDELRARIERERPRILGALLSALSGALGKLPHVRLNGKPRMADFAVLGVATEEALGWPSGSFLRAYDASRVEANEIALDASPLVIPIRQMMAEQKTWRGTATELWTKLTALAGEAEARRKEWPKGPRSLGGPLRRIAPNLAAIGIVVIFEPRTNLDRFITIYESRESVVTDVTLSQTPENKAFPGDKDGDKDAPPCHHPCHGDEGDDKSRHNSAPSACGADEGDGDEGDYKSRYNSDSSPCEGQARQEGGNRLGEKDSDKDAPQAPSLSPSLSPENTLFSSESDKVTSVTTDSLLSYVDELGEPPMAAGCAGDGSDNESRHYSDFVAPDGPGSDTGDGEEVLEL
jgi:hypothetical protein